MINVRRPRLRFVAILLALALLGTACGSDDNDDGSPSASSGPKLEKSEIVVAIALQAFSPKPWGRTTAEVWEEWVNNNGGLNGHPVRVVVVDTKNDPTVAQAAIKKVIADDKPIAFVGTNDQTIQTWYPQLAAAKIPSIGGPCYYVTIICSGPGASPLYFSATTTIPAITQSSIVYGAKIAKAKKFAAVVCAEVAACAAIEPVYTMTTDPLKLAYAGLLKVSASAPDYNAECLRLKEQNVDYVNLALLETVAVRFAKACASQGFKPEWSLTNGTVTQDVLDELVKTTGGRVSGGLDGPGWWIDDPRIKEMREAFDEYQPDADYRSGTTTAVWSAFELFRKAMTNASDAPTADEVTQAMLAMQDEDLDGLLPQSMTYKAGEPAPFINCFWLYEYTKDDGLKIVDGGGASGNSVTSGDLKSDCYPEV